MTVYDLESFDSDWVVPYCKSAWKFSKVSGKHNRHMTSSQY